MGTHYSLEAFGKVLAKALIMSITTFSWRNEKNTSTFSWGKKQQKTHLIWSYAHVCNELFSHVVNARTAKYDQFLVLGK